MRYSEIVGTEPLVEMGRDKRYIENKFMYHDDNINEHLIAILFSKSRAPVAHWKVEVRGWLSKLGRLRTLKQKPVPADVYLKHLLVGPFGTRPQEVIASFVQEVELKGPVNDIDLVEAFEVIKAFHLKMAALCASGQMVPTKIQELLDTLPE